MIDRMFDLPLCVSQDWHALMIGFFENRLAVFSTSGKAERSGSGTSATSRRLTYAKC